MNDGESRELRQRRALYRARHRGTKEMDWLLGRFAEAELSALPDAEFDCFENLLAIPDSDLERWIKFGDLNGAPDQSSYMVALISRIRRSHRLEE
jgi:antitoxin CptB